MAPSRSHRPLPQGQFGQGGSQQASLGGMAQRGTATRGNAAALHFLQQSGAAGGEVIHRQEDPAASTALESDPAAQEEVETSAVAENPNNSRIVGMFPGMANTPWRLLDVDSKEITDQPGQSAGYNCYGHAAGRTDDLQIDDMATEIGWEGAVPMEGGAEKLEIMDRFYASLGYGKVIEGSGAGAHIVLFGVNAVDPGHAAVRSGHSLGGDAMYESKLNTDELILHTLGGMEGGMYGNAIRGYSAG